MRVLGESSDDEMIACFLQGELSSRRFGRTVRAALASMDASPDLLTDPDLGDVEANRLRRKVLGATRGYGESRELFDADFPTRVHWIRAELSSDELSRVRYMDYSYWSELSGGSRLPSDAARRVRAGERVFGVSNARFERAARALERGESFAPLIVVGSRRDNLVCLEGHLRLTAYALVGFPQGVECLVGTAPTMGRWAH